MSWESPRSRTERSSHSRGHRSYYSDNVDYSYLWTDSEKRTSYEDYKNESLGTDLGGYENEHKNIYSGDYDSRLNRRSEYESGHLTSYESRYDRAFHDSERRAGYSRGNHSEAKSGYCRSYVDVPYGYSRSYKSGFNRSGHKGEHSREYEKSQPNSAGHSSKQYQSTRGHEEKTYYSGDNEHVSEGEEHGNDITKRVSTFRSGKVKASESQNNEKSSPLPSWLDSPSYLQSTSKRRRKDDSAYDDRESNYFLLCKDLINDSLINEIDVERKSDSVPDHPWTLHIPDHPWTHHNPWTHQIPDHPCTADETGGANGEWPTDHKSGDAVDSSLRADAGLTSSIGTIVTGYHHRSSPLDQHFQETMSHISSSYPEKHSGSLSPKMEALGGSSSSHNRSFLFNNQAAPPSFCRRPASPQKNTGRVNICDSYSLQQKESGLLKSLQEPCKGPLEQFSWRSFHLRASIGTVDQGMAVNQPLTMSSNLNVQEAVNILKANDAVNESQPQQCTSENPPKTTKKKKKQAKGNNAKQIIVYGNNVSYLPKMRVKKYFSKFGAVSSISSKRWPYFRMIVGFREARSAEKVLCRQSHSVMDLHVDVTPFPCQSNLGVEFIPAQDPKKMTVPPKPTWRTFAHIPLGPVEEFERVVIKQRVTQETLDASPYHCPTCKVLTKDKKGHIHHKKTPMHRFTMLRKVKLFDHQLGESYATYLTDMKNEGAKITFCTRCTMQYSGSRTDHENTDLHKRLVGLSEAFCNECSSEHESSVKLEKHLCSFRHIRNVSHKLEEAGVLEPEQCSETFQPGTPSGTSVVRDVKGFYCVPCDKFQPQKTGSITEHCATREHLLNLGPFVATRHERSKNPGSTSTTSNVGAMARPMFGAMHNNGSVMHLGPTSTHKSPKRHSKSSRGRKGGHRGRWKKAVKNKHRNNKLW